MNGTLLMSYIGACITVGAIARCVGRSFLAYTALSFFLSPIAGIIVLLIKGKVTQDEILDNTYHIYYCPHCRLTYKGKDTRKTQCSECKQNTLETLITVDTWRNYTPEQKEDVKHSFDQGMYLRHSPAMQPVRQTQSMSNADELMKYKQLLDSGAITQEKYESMKKQLLNIH
jgi:protein-arginine kinase activator protein McsA